MITFNNWSITATRDVIARQHDNLTRRIDVVGNLPDGWDWDLLVQVGDAMDIIALEPTEGGAGIALTRDQLAYGDMHYQLQLRGTQGELVQHTNIVTAYIPRSISGDGQWPEIPSEFTQLEERIRSEADRAEGAADVVAGSLAAADEALKQAGASIEAANQANQAAQESAKAAVAAAESTAKDAAAAKEAASGASGSAGAAQDAKASAEASEAKAIAAQAAAEEAAGKSGRFYTPKLSQPNEAAITISFDKSDARMDDVAPVDVMLPPGRKGDKGDPGTGVTILGSYGSEAELNDAHPTGAEGQAYLVGGDLYVWDTEESKWKNVGQIRGPEGEPGVYTGTDEPPEWAKVWLNPEGEPTGTEDWKFHRGDGTTEVKTLVVLGAETANGRLAVLKFKQEDGTWAEIPAIVGRQGDPGFSGVHIGTEDPPANANIWINPNGSPTGTEDWEFDLDGGATDTKTVVVLGAETPSGQLAVLRFKQADGTWADIPALVGPAGADGYTPVKNVDYFDGKDGQPGYTPVKGVDYVDGKDGYTPQKNIDYFDGKDGADGYTPVKGKDYVDGKDGQNGVSATHQWNGTTLSITSASGTSSADLKGDPGYSGVHFGSDTPPANANIWLNPNGVPTGTENWEFDLDSGATDTKTVVVLGSDTANGQLAILRFKQADGTWAEVPAIAGTAGRDGVDGYTPQKGVDYFDGKNGQDGYTPVKGVDYVDGKDGKDGQDGDDGVSPTVSVAAITGGHRITITDVNGTKTVDVMDGSDGKNGTDGAAGRGIKTVARTSGNGAAGTTDTYTITYTDSTTSTFTIYNGSNGKDGTNGKTAYEYAKDGGYTGTEAEFIAKLATAYLPLAGGALTGAVTLPNNIALKSKDGNGAGQELIRANASNQIVLGAAEAWKFIVSYQGMVPATSAVNSLDIGQADRCWRNLYLSGALSDGTNRITVANIANKNDIPTKTKTFKFTLEDGTVITEEVYVK